MIISVVNEVISSPLDLSETAPVRPTESEALLDTVSVRSGHRKMRAAAMAAPAKAISEELLDAYIKYGNNADGIPALHAAIKAKDERAVRLFLDHGADPNAKCNPPFDMHNIRPTTALGFAASYGNSNIVNFLIDRGAIVNPSEDEISHLCCAARFNNSETIQCLVRRGANLNKEGSAFQGALHVAVMYGSREAVKTLISLGLSPNRPDIYGSTPLMSGCWSNVTEDFYLGVEELLKNGANPNLKNDSGYTAFHFLAFNNRFFAALYPRSFKLVADLLIQYGADINARDLSGRTMLCYVEDAAFRKWLKDRGAIE